MPLAVGISHNHLKDFAARLDPRLHLARMESDGHMN